MTKEDTLTHLHEAAEEVAGEPTLHFEHAISLTIATLLSLLINLNWNS